MLFDPVVDIGIITAEDLAVAVGLLQEHIKDSDSITVVHQDTETTDGVVVPRTMRWRATPYDTIQGPQIAYRRIPGVPPDLDDLGLPPQVRRLASLDDGLIIAAGATGSGKTSTLAALVRQIAETRPVHILTIENPVEYHYPEKMAFITQREVEASDYKRALKVAMRSDPNVVMLGECLDKAEFEGCMDLAMTGHLVLTTLHARDAMTTCERIAKVTGEAGRSMLSQTLRAVIAQRLLPAAKDPSSRHCAAEVLINSTAVAKFISSGEMGQIRQHLSASGRSFDRILSRMVDSGQILEETARSACINEAEFEEYRKAAGGN